MNSNTFRRFPIGGGRGEEGGGGGRGNETVFSLNRFALKRLTIKDGLNSNFRGLYQLDERDKGGGSAFPPRWLSGILLLKDHLFEGDKRTWLKSRINVASEEKTFDVRFTMKGQEGAREKSKIKRGENQIKHTSNRRERWQSPKSARGVGPRAR